MTGTGLETKIVDEWSFYDIQDRVRDLLNDQDYILDTETGIAILKAMEKNYKADIGYNWDEVDYWYNHVVGESFDE